MAKITNPQYKPHFRITAIGTLGQVETFQYSLAWAAEGGVITPNSDGWADVAEDVRAFHGRAATSLSDSAVLRTVKIARIGSDGKYTADPRIIDVTPTPGANGHAAGPRLMILPQSALACSLLSDRRGPRGKGRFYLPMPALHLDQATMLADGPGVAAVQGSVQQLVNDLNNEPGVDFSEGRVVVASTEGQNHPVTAVRVGRVIDTIRSRRRAISESYAAPTTVSG